MDESSILRWEGSDAIQILDSDPDPRMRHTALASLLGYAHHHQLLRLSQRSGHREALLELGNFVTVTKFSTRGPAIKEPWWNEPQSLYLSCKSETLIANKITVQVIQQFDLYRKGLLVPNGNQIMAALKPHLDELNRAFNEFGHTYRADMVQLKMMLQTNAEGIAFCIEELQGSRRPFSEAVRRVHGYLIQIKFNGECPICRNIKIFIDGQWTPEAREHHHIARNNAAFNATIICCVQCHKKYHSNESVDFRAAFHAMFTAYHISAGSLRLPSSGGSPAPPTQLLLINPTIQ